MEPDLIEGGAQRKGAADGQRCNLLKLLAGAPVYRQFATAFQEATGLRVVLVSAPMGPSCSWIKGPSKTELCALLRHSRVGRVACAGFARQVAANAAAKRRMHCSECVAGLVVAAVPIFSGGEHVASLLAGPVLCGCRQPGDWKRMVHLLGDDCSSGELVRVKKALRKVPVMEGRRVRAAFVLLETLAQTLEKDLPAWVLAGSPALPRTVLKAKEYIRQHAGQPLRLPEVACYAGLSVQHFCALFRASTGLTFTQYVSRLRTENAKALLLNPARRITEIAFECGFGSLPTFNRTFRRFLGIAPTEFRRALRLNHPAAFEAAPAGPIQGSGSASAGGHPQSPNSAVRLGEMALEEIPRQKSEKMNSQLLASAPA